MITEPKVEHRPEQLYVAMRTQVALRAMGTGVIPQLHRDVRAWLDTQGIAPAGAPFIRYRVIDMMVQLDIEVGVPVAAAVAAEGRVVAGEFPAGRYTTLIYTGVQNAIPANAALQEWAAAQGTRATRFATSGKSRGSRLMRLPTMFRS